MDSDVSVLYIVGKGRSGSTILGDVLGSIEGVFHAGELWRIWRDGLTGNHSCSCGSPVMACPVWERVFEILTTTDVGRRAMTDPDTVVTRQRRLFTFDGLMLGALSGRLGAARRQSRELMAALYGAIASVTGARLLVDSSKWPLDPVLLEPPDGVMSLGLHLVRAPHDVANSWRAPKRFPDTGAMMPTYGPIHTALSWTGRNLAAEWATRRIGGRMMRVRFEDFIAAPQATVDRILRHARFPGTASNLIANDSTVVLAPGHTIMGNPSRFDHGMVRLEARATTRPVTSRTFGLVTYPLRRRYGYPV